MNKKYKYTKKHSFMEALDIRKKCERTVKRIVGIIFHLSPFWLPILFASFFSLKEKDSFTTLMANSFLAVLLIIPVYLLILLLELLLLGGYYIFLKIKIGLKQRYLPITKEDLEENEIFCVSDYWKYMKGILTVNGITCSIENINFYSECKKVYISYFSENKKCPDFEDKMRDLVETRPYSDFINDFLSKYMPLFALFIDMGVHYL